MITLDDQTILWVPGEPITVESSYNDVGDIFTNDNGAIRSHLVRSQYFSNKIQLPDVVDLYRSWRDDPEYMVLRKWIDLNEEQTMLFQNSSGFGDTWFVDEGILPVYELVKCSKRGNDVYQDLVDRKLSGMKELPNIQFFDDHTVDKRTCLLFVTLTYDTNLKNSDCAWLDIGKDFHLFHNNLRKKYGKVEIFRTWESTQNYYPHVHCMILFWDKDFSVLEHTNDDGKLTYRIPYKEVQDIAKYWHSNVDVQAMQDTHGCIKELTKYITKDLCSNKGDKTNAMIWLFRKQSYAISKGFTKAICGWNIDFNEPTNYDLINQMCNCNQPNTKLEFLGILRGRDLRMCGDIWHVELKKPPPRVYDLIKSEQLRWAMSHSKRC